MNSPPHPWTIAHASTAQRSAALGLLVGDTQAAVVEDLIRAGEIDSRGFFVALRDGQVDAALACLPMPGANALVWPPRGEPAAFADLLAASLGWLGRHGVKLAQAIVAPKDEPTLEPLESAGFVRSGPMHFLRRGLDDRPTASNVADLELVPLDEAPTEEIGLVLEQSYIGTLDFPELAGVRTIADVVASYQTNPILRPRASRLARANGRPVGVVLLAEVEALESWELLYLGIVPEARRRGVGRRLVLEALARVDDDAGVNLGVAVDSRNVPALQLYRGLGFQLVDERFVSLKFLDPNRELPPPP